MAVIEYDVIICGGGPAGLTAGIYTTRGALKTLIIEKLYAGGQMANTYLIENYPGVPLVGGMELGMAMANQASDLGVDFEYDEIIEIDVKNKTVKTSSGKIFSGKALILSFGAHSRETGLPSEQLFKGQGVAYCAICDGGFFKGKEVAVIGGGNTALEDAIYLRKFATKVYLVHRRDEFRASGQIVEDVKKADIEIIYNHIPVEFKGSKGKLEALVLQNVIDKSLTEYKLDGVFVAIGQIPNTELVKEQLKLSEGGYIIVDEQMQTSVEGVFACGDITNKQVRQIVTACSDGAIAAEAIIKMIR